MHSLRLLMAILLAGGAAAAWPTVVSAQPYPAGTPRIGVDTGAAVEGSATTVTGSGFLPFETIRIVVTFSGPARAVRSGASRAAPGKTVEVRADAGGTFTAQVPLTGRGTATIVATGLESGV